MARRSYYDIPIPLDSRLERLTENRFVSKNNTGLSIVFDGGEITTAVGSTIFYGGGTVTVPDNSVNYVMLDLYDKGLHVFPRAIHRGAVLIATVVSSNGRIKSIKQPQSVFIKGSRISKFKSSLKRKNRKLRVALIGDSLTQGAGGTPRWTDILFSVNQSSLGLNVVNAENIMIDNYAVGGQTAHFGAVQLGVGVRCATGKYPNSSVSYGPRYLNAYSDYLGIAANVKESDTRVFQYDLAIVNLGVNGGSDNYAFTENIIRELRNRGTEVIIGTSNFRTDNPDFYFTEGFHMSQLAEAYGCELVDVWSYVKEAANNGKITHADTIHMSTEGHMAWAKAMRSVLNDIDQVGDTFSNSNQNRIYISDTTTGTSSNGKFPNEVEVVFHPLHHTGTVSSVGGSTPKVNNPALQFGGKTPTDCSTTLTSGQSAWFGHGGAMSADVLYEMSTPFKADIYTQGGSTKVTSISNSTIQAGRVALAEAVGFGNMPNSSSIGLVNQSIQVVVTEGTLNLVGMAFHTWKKKEIIFEEMVFSGTWGTENGGYSPSVWKYTDIDGDSVFFEFEGTGCTVLLNQQNAGGKIDVWVDGVQVQTGLDLYGTGKTIYPLNLFGIRDATSYNRGYGNHNVRIKLNGVNASAVAPNAQNRRLAIYGVSAFDSR